MKVIFISASIWFYPTKETLGIKDELLKKNVEYWSIYYLTNKILPSKILDKKEIEKNIFLKKQKIF